MDQSRGANEHDDKTQVGFMWCTVFDIMDDQAAAVKSFGQSAAAATSA
jgi:hypothetical protein